MQIYTKVKSQMGKDLKNEELNNGGSKYMAKTLKVMRKKIDSRQWNGKILKRRR
jgi:hypothetical protein